MWIVRQDNGSCHFWANTREQVSAVRRGSAVLGTVQLFWDHSDVGSAHLAASPTNTFTVDPETAELVKFTDGVEVGREQLEVVE